ncbi:MAG: polysaccharide deacetylase family protein [Desulfovermiculus sp.]|nr:polysaccharide deacetylase family protein [Desulfovermiculus sp.]
MSYKLAAKKYTAELLRRTCVFKLLSLSTAKEKAPVLMYHRVLDTPEQESVFVQPGMYVTTKTFRLHVAYLKKNYQVISLQELAARVRDGKDVGQCCVITFDDGWLDTYTQAYPVLQEFDVPASIFLATGLIGTKRLFWPEEFAAYLQSTELRDLARHKSRMIDEVLSRASDMSKDELLDGCISALKTLPVEEREELLTHLQGMSKSDPPGRMLLDWDEVREMQDSGLVSFGAHTADHVILDQVSLEQAEEEIVQSKLDMQEHLGGRPEVFAYPNGNYNADIQGLLEKHGFLAAVTTKKGWVGPGTNMLEIPRIGMHEHVSRTVPLFLARMYLRRF